MNFCYGWLYTLYYRCLCTLRSWIRLDFNNSLSLSLLLFFNFLFDLLIVNSSFINLHLLLLMMFLCLSFRPFLNGLTLSCLRQGLWFYMLRFSSLFLYLRLWNRLFILLQVDFISCNWLWLGFYCSSCLRLNHIFLFFIIFIKLLALIFLLVILLRCCTIIILCTDLEYRFLTSWLLLLLLLRELKCLIKLLLFLILFLVAHIEIDLILLPIVLLLLLGLSWLLLGWGQVRSGWVRVSLLFEGVEHDLNVLSLQETLHSV